MTPLEELRANWRELRDALKIAKESIEHAEDQMKKIPKDVLKVLEGDKE